MPSVLALVVASVAAVLHVVIFAMESVLWTRPAVWRRFGVADQRAAETLRPMAYNQGFYNLFLAVIAIVGVVSWSAGATDVGRALVIAALACMVAAAVVLTTTGRGYLRSALVQGTVPAVGLVLALLA